MEKKKIVAVILNYKTWQDAIECVDTLLEMEYDNHAVVIVENGSGNESLEKLRDRYGGNPRVYLVESELNLGFAKGNNLGIRYARIELAADFVYVANSDTLITDKKLYSQIIECYEEGIGVISPTLQKLDGSYHMPAINCDNIYKEALNALMGVIYGYCLYDFKEKRKQKRRFVEVENKEYEKKVYVWKQYVVHGPAYFLTPDFFKYYTQIYPKTFLYWEEINLLMYICKAGLRSVLVDTSVVIHKLNGVTGQVFKDKERMRLKESVKSGFKSVPMFMMSKKMIKCFFSK